VSHFNARIASVPSSPILDYLDSLRARFGELSEGNVASYIPELARADPDEFGICIATRDGFVYEIGDSRQLFSIQSISKPLTYGLALEQNGEDAVLGKIGVEPSGDAFNAVSLRPQSGAPLNPLINAGAIAACGLIAGDTVQQKTACILDGFSRYAGRPLDINEQIYESESETGHRNRAIRWMLRNFEILADEPTPTLETHFRQCSILVTCRDLAMIGATLANGGVNPVTGIRAIAEEYGQRPFGNGDLRHVRLLGRMALAEAGVWWQRLIDAGVDRDAFYADDDFALEFGENLLLARRFPDQAWEAKVPLANCALFTGLTREELALLEGSLACRSYHNGQTIISTGQASDDLFVITDGAAMVSISTQDGVARLDAFTSGMTFGELAFLDRSPRSADVTALGAVECRVLTRDAFAKLDREAPAIKIRLLENLALGLTGMLR
jgi:glutaminase